MNDRWTVIGRGFVGTALANSLGARLVGSAEFEPTSSPVIYASGIKDVEACERDPALAAQLNMYRPREIARKTLGVFVYLSTDYVFDGLRGRYKPSDTPNPKTAYGVSKLRGEDAVLAASGDTLVVRTSHVMGPGCPWIDWLCGVLGSGSTVGAWGDVWNTPTPVSVLALGIESALALGDRGVVHVAGPQRMNRVQLLRRVAESHGFDPSRIHEVTCRRSLTPRDVSLEVS